MTRFVSCTVLAVLLSAGLERQTGAAQMDAAQVFSNPRMLEAARAVERGDASALEGLVRNGLNVNERGRQGMTLLLWAMRSQKKDSLRALLKLKADPNQKLDNRDGPVTIAAGAPDSEVLTILLDHGGDPNARNRLDNPAIDEAIDRSLWRNYDMLVERGADPGAVDRSGATPLVRLAQLNQFLDVERLLNRGINLNTANRRGRTLGWYVENSPVDPAHPQGQARERVRAALKARGAK